MSSLRIPQDYKKNVQKSVKDWSTTKRTTFHAGEILPIWSRRVMAGSKVIIDPYTLLASNPLVSKLLGTFKLQVGIFFDSDTNYYGWLDNNRKNSTQDLLKKTRHRYDFLTQFCIPEMGYETDEEMKKYFNGQMNNFRGSVLDYMRVPSGLVLPWNQDDVISDSVLGRLDLGFVLTYLNIFRNYYSSKQEAKFPYISNFGDFEYPDSPDVDGDAPQLFGEMAMSSLDDFFMALRNTSDGIDFSDSAELSDPRLAVILPYLQTFSNPHGGILLSTYLPDLMRNLLDDTYNTASSTVEVTNGKFSIDTLRFRNKLQRLIDRYDVSDGRFSGWLKTVWGVNTRKDLDIPELIGVAQQIIDPNQVTAQSSGDGVDLGQFGGNFNKPGQHRKHSFVASTPGRAMVCVTLVPLVDYSQGIDPELTHVNYADDYYPEFAQLGYQKVPYFVYSPNATLNIETEQILNSDGSSSGVEQVVNIAPVAGSPTLLSAGKQVAWLAEQTDIPTVHGEFGNGGYYESWVLKRRYHSRRFDSFWTGASDPREIHKKYVDSTEITHYINPLDYQYPFVGQSILDPNWELQMGLNIKAVLPIGKRFMPNLE